MEVMVPPPAEFHADSTSSTPYASAPTSPRRGGEWAGRFYTSAPASPSRAAAIFREFNAAMGSPRASSRSSVIPFEWEEAPGTPKSQQQQQQRKEEQEEEEEDVDFAFDFSGQLDLGGSSPLTADELFEEGMIRPLKLPPRLQYVPPPPGINGEKSPGWSPRSPRSPAMRFRRSPRRWGTQEDIDPFAAAIEETTRGRDRGAAASGDDNTGRRNRRAARSLSPLRRVFDFHGKPPAAATVAPGGAAPATTVSTSAAAAAVRWMKGGGTKWRLKDLLLFRSASEGRASGGAADKDPLRKYTALSPSSAAMLSRKGSAASTASISSAAAAGEEVRNSSFRSTDGGSVGGSSRRGASAHERHYAANRAAAEELRRKTMLPYRQGLFGCLGFNPAINGLAKGFSTFRTRP